MHWIRARWNSRGEWLMRGCRGYWVSQLPLATLLQALEKKGISHLDEKDLKERNKRIQEDNRLELQKVGSDVPSLPPSDREPCGQPSSPSHSPGSLVVLTGGACRVGGLQRAEFCCSRVRIFLGLSPA